MHKHMYMCKPYTVCSLVAEMWTEYVKSFFWKDAINVSCLYVDTVRFLGIDNRKSSIYIYWRWLWILLVLFFSCCKNQNALKMNSTAVQTKPINIHSNTLNHAENRSTEPFWEFLQEQRYFWITTLFFLEKMKAIRIRLVS